MQSHEVLKRSDPAAGAGLWPDWHREPAPAANPRLFPRPPAPPSSPTAPGT